MKQAEYQISLFDGDHKLTIDKPIRLIELFAGYGSQALAYKQHIRANAIIINENFVSVPSILVGNVEYPPMICGLEMHYTRAELPDNTMFAVFEVRETEREKAIRLAKEEVVRKVKKYIDELFDKVDDLTQE